ncbi:MAG: hypothetical protein OQL16_03340 [Gammaproteobacteria bacterium]|nr:hypothetical protein [Gammaproteobacteria bacterium]
MKENGFQQRLAILPVKLLAAVIVVGILSGCSFFPSTSTEKTNRPEVLGGSIALVPIIYTDRVVEYDPRTGQERIVPDEDLIVENGKVWGRYLRLGKDVEYIMSYHNHLCAPALTVNIDTIGESSRPVRSFSVPEEKYDDCKDEEMKKAAKRVRAIQSKTR